MRLKRFWCKNKNEDGFIYLTDCGSFRDIDLCDLQIQTSISILTNDYGMSMVQASSGTTTKSKLRDDDVFLVV